MLKFEKRSRKGDINVIVKDKDGWANRTLLIAFLCALFIHLSFILVFTVTPFSFGKNLGLYPPVQVDTPFRLPSTQIQASTEGVKSIYTGLPEKRSLVPEISQTPYLALAQPLEWFERSEPPPIYFENIEQQIYSHSLDVEKPEIKPLQLKICGPLGNCVLINDGVVEAELSRLGDKAPRRARFAVLVESSKVFWYEPLETTGARPLDMMAQSILKRLRFNQLGSERIVSGQIEMHFNVGEKVS